MPRKKWARARCVPEDQLFKMWREPCLSRAGRQKEVDLLSLWYRSAGKEIKNRRSITRDASCILFPALLRKGGKVDCLLNRSMPLWDHIRSYTDKKSKIGFALITEFLPFPLSHLAMGGLTLLNCGGLRASLVKSGTENSHSASADVRECFKIQIVCENLIWHSWIIFEWNYHLPSQRNKILQKRSICRHHWPFKASSRSARKCA